MRSVLSILGILIGVAAVIAMLALGTGAKASIEQQLSSLGSNLLMVHAGHARSMGIAMQSTVTRFTMEDVNVIAKLPSVKRVYGSVTSQGQIVFGNKNWNTQIEGAGIDYPAIRAATPVLYRGGNSRQGKSSAVSHDGHQQSFRRQQSGRRDDQDKFDQF